MFTYYALRLFGFLISLLSYPMLHRFGNFAGTCAYYLYRPFRKKALANLAIAFHESKSEKERRSIAKKSFQNLMITCLEFFRFKRGSLSGIVTLQHNPELEALLDQKQGMIFLTAHQANWEVSFLALTERYQGIAIGRPIKNQRLYKLILSVRERNGGKIVTPKQAIKASLRALSQGKFLGIVGDQAYPESPYSYPLFGTRAWTASTPALLAYKTGAPLVVGTTQRINGRYVVSGSSPIWPDTTLPIKEEVPRMMDAAMMLLEESIKKIPEQWMWVHDRWKQQGIDHVKRQYRYGFILILLPENPAPFLEILPVFKQIYSKSFLTFFAPQGTSLSLEGCNIKFYSHARDLFIRDFRYQLILDFYQNAQIRRHFLKLGALTALSVKDFKQGRSLKEKIVCTLVKPECHHLFKED